MLIQIGPKLGLRWLSLLHLLLMRLAVPTVYLCLECKPLYSNHQKTGARIDLVFLAIYLKPDHSVKPDRSAKSLTA
jgi:hypothetical protein